MPNQNAVQDNNQFPSVIVVQGTTGTADVNGTSPTMTVGGNPVTGAMYVEDLSSDPGTVTISGTVPVSVTGTPSVSGTVDANILPLGGLVLAGTIGVGTAIAAIPTSTLSGRKALILYNDGTARVFLGGSAVTSTTGLPVASGDYSPSFDLGTTILYGVTSAGVGTVRVLEVS